MAKYINYLTFSSNRRHTNTHLFICTGLHAHNKRIKSDLHKLLHRSLQIEKNELPLLCTRTHTHTPIHLFTQDRYHKIVIKT